MVSDQDRVAQWIVYNIAGSIKELPAGLPNNAALDNGLAQGGNDLGGVGYAGPCQPKGEFKYVFRVFALDTALNLLPGIDKDSLIRAMNGHIIDMATLPVSHVHRF